RKSGLEARRVTLKLRYFDFATCTRARTLENHVRSDSAIFEQAKILLMDNWIGDKPVRLLGISVSKLRDITDGLQEELFDYLGEEKKIAVSEVMDKIKDVYGDRSITYSSATTRLKWS
ncbi:MAG: hypothetical protein GF307_13570, partial [candidate division Zixibacteria bacterium]|nr:hypothetical protein [candidate division Zixibacteria bacterium]